ncbi:hypothetical protein [Halalkalibacter oceani]|uniref:hypothetical protein n=1 Tax=Halalkalibacter oceani TaxID=1653776 RepID=UPI00339B03DF
MSGNKVERVFVQGSVSFNISCNDLMGLVTKEQADDKEYMKQWLVDKAFKLIDLASKEVEFDYEKKVLIDEELADKYTGEIITDKEWKEIRENNKGE